MAVIGAEQGWVFIRHEYGPEEHVLRAEIDAARAAGVIGADACGSGRRLDVDVFVSPGGYILGEETALLECMGILAAARAFGLDFIPIAREPYDLVVRASTVDDALLAPLWALLQSSDFRAEVESLGGYSCAETGRRIR